MSISGVYGKLNTPNCETIWRLNIGETKHSLTIADFSAVGTFDRSWIDQIQTSSYGYGSGGYGSRNPNLAGNPSATVSGGANAGKPVGTGATNSQNATSSTASGAGSSAHPFLGQNESYSECPQCFGKGVNGVDRKPCQVCLGTGFYRDIPDPVANQSSSDVVTDLESAGFGSGKAVTVHANNGNVAVGNVTSAGGQADTTIEIDAILAELYTEEELKQLAQEHGMTVEEIKEKFSEFLVAEAVANGEARPASIAIDMAKDAINDLHGNDDALISVMGEAFDSLSAEGQAKVQSNGL